MPITGEEKVQLFEINTRLWLKVLSAKYDKIITLANVPSWEINYLYGLGFDAVWLMGVWSPSKAGREVALRHEGLRGEFLNVLPDLHPEDVACSPYCISGYKVPKSLGGASGLAEFKKALNNRGMKLIVDFVPNHLAMDHQWISVHPDYFIRGSSDDIARDPLTFFRTKQGEIIAHGKDPYFPAWTDVAQLNYYNPELRADMTEELIKISSVSDGVRCDMAMLVLNRIMRQTWGDRVTMNGKYPEPAGEFWTEVIPKIKSKKTGFVFIAETYWGLDHEIAGLGVDKVYDKFFYDALRDGKNDDIRLCLKDTGPMAQKHLRFIENHDEPRAAEAFGESRSKAAALLLCVSGASQLIHQGQMEGRSKKVPVQLLRLPEERTGTGTKIFYDLLFTEIKKSGRISSPWTLLDPRAAWEGNWSWKNMFIFMKGSEYLAVINNSGSNSQCYVNPEFPGAMAGSICLKDLLGDAEYVRDKSDIRNRGLYLDLPPYGYHLFRLSEV